MKVHDLEDFAPDELVNDKMAIYLMATYGGTFLYVRVRVRGEG
jgi:hypothetical protein